MALLPRKALKAGVTPPAHPTSAPRKMGGAPGGKVVHTATLIRGRVYFYKDQKFERDIETVVTMETARLLEDLIAEVRDGDGEITEKQLFHVKYNTAPPPPPPSEDDQPRRRIRNADAYRDRDR